MDPSKHPYGRALSLLHHRYKLSKGSSDKHPSHRFLILLSYKYRSFNDLSSLKHPSYRYSSLLFVRYKNFKLGKLIGGTSVKPKCDKMSVIALVSLAFIFYALPQFFLFFQTHQHC